MKKADLEYMKRKHVTEVNGEEITYHKILNDINGNSRAVVHFLSLGIKREDYGKVPGLEKYRAKWFAGGYVFQSCNIAENLKWMLKQVEVYYKNKNA